MNSRQIRELTARMHEEMRTLQQKLPGRCLAIDDSGNSCTSSPVKAHTLAKGVFLKNLAEDGHVFSYSPWLNRVGVSDPPVSVPEKRGIKNASTFPGFCQSHDAKLFGAVERRPFESTAEQVFLLAYRAMCYELYIKELESHRKMRYIREKYENKLPKHTHDTLSRIRAVQATGTASGLRDTQFHKESYDRSLERQRFTDVTGYVIEVAGDPVMMCCSGVTPSYDFSGEFLQDMQDDNILGRPVTVTAFTDRPGRWFVVLAWHKESDPVGQQLVASLQQQEDPTSSITSLLFVHCGNLHFRISWWKSLPAETREWLMSLWTLTAILAKDRYDLQQRMPLPPWDIVRLERCS